jgi:anionic cell wall polymer biosynthesis LytR-Cps2A-Psr (LCP) family protein
LAYAYGDGREKSCRYMTEAVSRLLGGLSIDGYMAVSMSVLPLANDKVGGVTVTIEEPELKTVNPAFVQGQTVTLRGGQAEEYVRYRDTGRAQSALVRMERQKTYIKGFLDAARNKSRLDDGLIPDLMKEIEPYMVTDMTKDRYLNMALDFLGGNQDFTETDMVTLPGTAVETVIYDEYHPDQEEIMEIVLDWFYRPRE